MTMAIEEKAARVYRQFDSFMHQAVRSATRTAHIRLVGEAGKASRAYGSGAGLAAALAEIQDWVWAGYLGRVWGETVTHAGRLAVEALGITNVDAGIFERAARLYLDRQGKRRGAGIAGTSRKAVLASIEAGREARETPAEVARRILADAEEMAMWRSATIGSTQAHAAGMFGAWTGAVKTLPGWGKGLAAPRAPGITCDQHKTAHGQRRGLREAFEVANDYEEGEPADRLNYPGDGELGARPSNVINCRCAIEFVRR